jgi:hypothetical protein
MSDEILALLDSPAPAGVTIKPLVWEYHPAGAIAAPPTGHAYIIDTRMKGRVYSLKGFNPAREFESKDEAKAAAQADYEARIMAVLEPAAAGVTVPDELYQAAKRDAEEAEAYAAELEKERGKALNQLDSARHSIAVLEKRVKTFSEGWGVADKKRLEAEDKLAKALRKIELGTTGEADPDTGELIEVWMGADEMQEIARATLAELKGEKDE